MRTDLSKIIKKGGMVVAQFQAAADLPAGTLVKVPVRGFEFT